MKKKQPLKDALSFLLEGRQYVTYADYAYGAPLFTKAVLSNAHAEAVEGVTVTFSDDGSLLAEGGRDALRGGAYVHCPAL